jgi:hypothetical protein
VDLSRSFVHAARRLAHIGEITADIVVEGGLLRPITVRLPERLRRARVEFLVADAMALPFASGVFAAVASLNVVDKVPKPLAHVRELGRVGRVAGCELLLTDPFSWSREIAPGNEWLGGTDCGPFPGRGEENVFRLLQGKDGHVVPPFEVERPKGVWWSIRTHENHYERIRSISFRAVR